MLIIAHRGSCKSYGGVENSFSAYSKAVKLGSQRIELDARLTKDEKVIICHNPVLKIGKKKYRIDKTNYSTLKSLKYPNEDPVEDLHSVLENFLDKIELNIELKGRNPKLCEKVVELLHLWQKNHQKTDMYKRVIISSFNSNLLKKTHELDSKITLAYLLLKNIFALKFKRKILKITDKYNIKILHPNVFLVSKSFMRWAKSKRFKVYSWAGFCEEDNLKKRSKIWDNLKKYKVDGHCTNYVEELQEFVGRGKK